MYKNTTWVFLYTKYSKFWSVSLEHFVERKPLISEEWLPSRKCIGAVLFSFCHGLQITKIPQIIDKLLRRHAIENVFFPILLYYIVCCSTIPRVVYDRVRKRKNYFEICTFLQIEQGKSRAGKFKTSNDNINQNILVLVFVFIWFWISSSWYSSFNLKKGLNFKIIFPFPYHIIYNPGLYRISPRQKYFK